MSKKADILETEHARYKKALEKIRHAHAGSSYAYQFAEAALNPPSLPVLPPPTIAELCAALRKSNSSGKMHNITFFSDESGRIKAGDGDGSDAIHHFYTLREALDFLKGAAPLA